MSLPPVGVQPIVFGNKYSWKDQPEVILDFIAKAGYASVEGGGVADAAQYRAMLDERGLVCTGTHTGPSAFSDCKKIIDRLAITGGTDVLNSGLKDWNARTLPDYMETIKILNDAGREFHDAGLRLHYHHHDFEFLDKIEGTTKTGMELFIEGLDPEYVDICCDVAWVAKGGHDPVEFLTKHQDRITYLHFKDFDDNGWIELGRGKVDFPAIMKLLPNLPKIRWVMTEQDSSIIDPGQAITDSRAYLRDTFNY